MRAVGERARGGVRVAGARARAERSAVESALEGRPWLVGGEGERRRRVAGSARGTRGDRRLRHVDVADEREVEVVEARAHVRVAPGDDLAVRLDRDGARE